MNITEKDVGRTVRLRNGSGETIKFVNGSSPFPVIGFVTRWNEKGKILLADSESAHDIVGFTDEEDQGSDYGGQEIRERARALAMSGDTRDDWLTARWIYRAFNEGWEICYVGTSDHIKYFLEGDDRGIHSDEEVVKHICKLHNDALDNKTNIK